MWDPLAPEPHSTPTRPAPVWTLPDPEPVLNPYNNSLVMPLHEFVEHPIAEELLHNGAALQVAEAHSTQLSCRVSPTQSAAGPDPQQSTCCWA